MSKTVTEESIAKLYHALSGKTPPGAELTEAQREAREKQNLQERVLKEIVECREQEKLDRLAEALGFSPSTDTYLPDAALSQLFAALR